MAEPVYVGISGDQLMTWKGRLIVARTEQERTALVGTVVELPEYRVSVTDWLADHGFTVDGKRIGG